MMTPCTTHFIPCGMNFIPCVPLDATRVKASIPLRTLQQRWYHVPHTTHYILCEWTSYHVYHLTQRKWRAPSSDSKDCAHTHTHTRAAALTQGQEHSCECPFHPLVTTIDTEHTQTDTHTHIHTQIHWKKHSWIQVQTHTCFFIQCILLYRSGTLLSWSLIGSTAVISAHTQLFQGQIWVQLVSCPTRLSSIFQHPKNREI